MTEDQYYRGVFKKYASMTRPRAIERELLSPDFNAQDFYKDPLDGALIKNGYLQHNQYTM